MLIVSFENSEKKYSLWLQGDGVCFLVVPDGGGEIWRWFLISGQETV